ncbi:MAG: WYL domain-containing protein [Prevotella sp.]|nr:WYL domain-containing protein [Prevotella sp.]
MVTTLQIKRYAWVVEQLLRRRGLTIAQINDEWMRSSLSEYDCEKPNRKTWYKCFEDIGMIYGVIIEVSDRQHGCKWHIINPEVLRGKDVQNWMLSCVAHRNLLEECMGMYNRTDIEGFPSENGMLEPVTRAMKDCRKMSVWYRRYGRSVPKHYIVEPYFIKTYNHRFYVLCKFDTGLFYTLSFDRIEELEILPEKFNFPNDLFAQDFFQNAYGVIVPNNGEKAVDIVVRAKGDAVYYLEDVPLHHSQQKIKEEKDYADFKVHILVTNDFIGAILHQGDRLEIMSPKPVRDKVMLCLERALAPYRAA